ncbi:MAG: rhomboid family intramembrane serine protease [Verrucomicrobia bacterium]|nr:rhomboid family intramembrane serine protease [Verrucomicrobiota bacterium]
MLEDRDYMRQPEYREPMFHGFHWSWTAILIAANLAVFVLMEIFKAYNIDGFLKIFQYCALSNDGIAHGHIWQFFSFQFLHASRGHFVGNMLGLFFLGRMLESMIGGKRFLLLYITSGLIGGVFQIILGLIFPTVFGIPVVGASAGVFGVLAALGTLAPESEVLVFFVFPVKMKYIALAGAIVAAFYILVPAEIGVAHAAHLGGMAMGWFFVRKILQGDWSRLTGAFRRAEKEQPRRPKREPAESKGDTEFLEGQVDPILDKISAHGIGSLTAREREILEAARKKMTRT